MTSIARQNYHLECEAAINKQINLELYASYVYMSMAYYCDRDDIAMKGFHLFFKKASDEERDHAEKFQKYQNMRGGRIVLQDVVKPSRDDWGTALDLTQAALELEKKVNQSLIDLHNIAEKHNDNQLQDFLEGEFLKEQVDSIKELSDMVANIKRAGPGTGLYMFDQDLLHKLS